MKKIISIWMVVMSVFVIQSCTDLDPEVYSEILPEDFFKNEQQLQAFTAAAYTPLQGYWGTMIILGDGVSDVTTVPIRSNGGWDDGGVWPRLMRHEFTPQNNVSGAWNLAFNGVATCNRLIEFLDAQGGIDPAVIAELRALRAYYLWFGLEHFGNVPVVLKFAEADPNPSQSPPEETFAVIEKELLESIPDLTEAKDISTYAKMNKWVAYMTLAKLYINAERYNVGPHYTEAADAINNVIASNKYELSEGYFSNFRIKNEGSSENMFVVPYDRVVFGGFDLTHQALHQSAGATFGYSSAPWGGYSVQEDFYNAYDAKDKRLGMFIVGQQYLQAAGPQWSNDAGFFYANPKDELKLFNCDEDFNSLSLGEREQLGMPPNSDGANYEDACNVFISPNYTFTVAETGVRPDITPYRHGARFGKYELEQNTPPGMSNDFAIFRYGEALLIRAEALFRANGDNAESKMLVNQIRSRAGLDPLDVLTIDDIYQELKKELALEGQGREITIRFGHWEDEWMLKTDSDPRKRWFPIPQEQTDANPNLVQVEYVTGG